jgi:hypothetical protein
MKSEELIIPKINIFQRVNDIKQQRNQTLFDEHNLFAMSYHRLA